VPEVHGKADIASPEGIPTSAQLIARLAALGYSSCGECTGAFEPHRVACSPMEFEKCISVAAGAMTEIGAGRRGTERVLGIAPIDSVQHVSELRSRDRNHARSRQRPNKPAALQPLGVERHADPVMPENFYQRAAASAKHVEVAGMRLCGAPHNRSYVSGEIMFRRRRDDSQGRPCRDSSAT